MKCPKCQTKVPDIAAFCNECGNKLEFVSSECQTLSPPGSKFCIECGKRISLAKQPIETLSFEEKLDKIQRYLPKGLTEKILAKKSRIEGEKKQITVMFCDMVGSTAMAEKLDPEEAYSIMDQVLEILIREVHDYGGTVNKMTGDGIMALFGAPIALEDGPQRAIGSAIAIHKEINRFSERLSKEKEGMPAIIMRIGINTGPVVVGTIGNSLRIEFTAMGDTVNLASRMESAAEHGTTLVTEKTFKLTEVFFRFESKGEKKVKGKKKPVNVYQVIAPSNRSTRFDVSAERGLTPLVGREKELEILMESFELVKSGRGQALSIVAEAGTGKSRLAYEFRKAVANEDVTILEGKSLSFTKNNAYRPIMDMVKSGFSIDEEDTADQIRNKLVKGLQVIKVEESKNLPYLLELLNIENNGVDLSFETPDLIKDGIIGTITTVSLKSAQVKPLIIIIEDLHWIDKSSEDWLAELLENIVDSRILLIFTHRPEYKNSWIKKPYYNQVNLNNLSNKESVLMLSILLNTDSVDENLERLVIERTRGIPYYIEEFVRSLIDLKILEKKRNQYQLTKDSFDVAIPSSVQDIIMTRIDALLARAKEVIRIASIIEREFSFELIHSVMDISEKELRKYLTILKDSDFLHERGTQAEAVYNITHTLTGEVVRGSILAKRKAKLHEQIGCAIEELYKENIVDYHATLVEHFIAGKNYNKGALYSKFAARAAQKHSDFNSAILYTEKRVKCIEKLPQSQEMQKRLIDTRAVLGLYYTQMDYHIEGKEAIEPIIDLTEKLGYKRSLAQINTILGSYYILSEGDAPKAIEYLEKADRLAREAKDSASSALANISLALAHAEAGDFEKALESYEKSLHISMAANSLWGVAQLKGLISYWVYNITGQLDLGYRNSEEAVDIADESGALHSKAIANISHGRSNLFKGFLNEASTYLQKGVEFCERINHYYWNCNAQLDLGMIYLELGEYQKALRHFNNVIQFGKVYKLSPRLSIESKILAAVAEILIDQLDTDLTVLYSYYNEYKGIRYKGVLQNNIAKILLNIDEQHGAEAEDWIKKAIKTNKKYGLKGWSGKPYVLYAEFYKRQGDLPKARIQMNKAIKIMKGCGADGWVERYKNELAALS